MTPEQRQRLSLAHLGNEPSNKGTSRYGIPGGLTRAQYLKEWRKLNPDKLHLQRVREWQNNKEAMSFSSKLWHKLHLHQKYPAQRAREERLKMMLFEILGGAECVYCSCQIYQALQFEHKNNDGNIDKSRFNHRRQMILYYCNHPDEAREKLQVACANCNTTKKFKEGKGYG